MLEGLTFGLTLEMPRLTFEVSNGTPAPGTSSASWRRIHVDDLYSPDGEPLGFYFTGELVDDDRGAYSAVIDLTQATEEAGTITIAASGSAVAGVNYTLPTTTIAVPAGALEVAVPITVLAAGKWFVDRFLVLTITGVSGGVTGVGADNRFFLGLHPATAAPSIHFDASTASGPYSAPITVGLTLSAQALDPVKVWAFAHPAATTADRADYTLSPGIQAPVTIAAGSTSATASLTWTGLPPSSTETVVVALAHASTSEEERNLYTLSETLALEGPTFPTLTEALERGDQVGSVAFEADGLAPDGSAARIVYPFDVPDGPANYLRKSFNGYVVGGPDQLQPLVADQTLSAYVSRPTNVARASERWALSILRRGADGVQVPFTALWSWDPATGAPVFEEDDSINLALLVGYEATVLGEDDDPNDPWLQSGWWRVRWRVQPKPEDYGEVSQRFLWPWRKEGSSQTLNQALSQRLGVRAWGFQFERSAPTPYQPRQGLWHGPRGGAHRSSPSACVFSITT